MILRLFLLVRGHQLLRASVTRSTDFPSVIKPVARAVSDHLANFNPVHSRFFLTIDVLLNHNCFHILSLWELLAF